MNIGVIIVSHSNLSQGMRDAVEFITGEQEGLYNLSLDETGIEKFREKLVSLTEDIKEHHESLVVLSDIPAGSPGANALDIVSALDLPAKVVSGMNLALTLDVILSREFKSLEQLVNDALISAKESLQILEAHEMLEEDEDF